MNAENSNKMLLNNILNFVFGFMIGAFLVIFVSLATDHNNSGNVTQTSSSKTAKIVHSTLGYNTQAYEKANTEKERMNVLNQAYVQGDIKSLRQINKRHPSNFAKLALNATIYHYARIHNIKDHNKMKAQAAEQTLTALSNMTFKNRSVARQYSMFSNRLVHEINLIVQENQDEFKS